MCTTKDIGELFINKPDELVLAFDAIYTRVNEWQPNFVGASIHAAVFTNKKAWLIIKPMKSMLDIKFYYPTQLDSELVFKTVDYRNKFAHHIRVATEYELTNAHFDLLKKGYDYALQD
ncbi:MAG: DUF5655 domain-containing protein [Cyclobacteriaceae bacterium]